MCNEVPKADVQWTQMICAGESYSFINNRVGEWKDLGHDVSDADSQ